MSSNVSILTQESYLKSVKDGSKLSLNAKKLTLKQVRSCLSRGQVRALKVGKSRSKNKEESPTICTISTI